MKSELPLPVKILVTKDPVEKKALIAELKAKIKIKSTVGGSASEEQNGSDE